MTFTGSLSKPPWFWSGSPRKCLWCLVLARTLPLGPNSSVVWGVPCVAAQGATTTFGGICCGFFMPHLAILSRYRQNQAHSCPKPSYCRCIGMVRGMDIRNTCHRKSMSCSFHVSTSWTNTANCCLVAMCVAMATSPSGLPSSSMAFLVLTCHASRPPSLWLNCFGGCLCVWPSFW